jgi:hypothetical protein
LKLCSLRREHHKEANGRKLRKTKAGQFRENEKDLSSLKITKEIFHLFVCFALFEVTGGKLRLLGEGDKQLGRAREQF